MRSYKPEDFQDNPAWLMCRVDIQIQNQAVDAYLIMDLPSTLLLAHVIVEDTITKQQVKQLISQAQKQYKRPKRIILANGDPAEKYLIEIATDLNIFVEHIPEPYLESLIAPFKQSFGEHFFSPTSIAHLISDEKLEAENMSREELIASLPDSYSPCSCNSGKKYKFCCKKIFREVTEAMCEAEDGHLEKALEWIEKARAVVGDTGEILCREAIVYSFFNKTKTKYHKLLHRCLTEFPNYPRAHYIYGIDLKGRYDFTGAIKAYKTAIDLYPTSDQYHLNEAYNNLGTAFYENGNIKEAQLAWEKALFFMPSDRYARDNLNELIYK